MSNNINYRTDLRSSSLWRGRHCASLRMHTSSCSTARKQVPGLLSFGLMLASRGTQSNCVLFSKHPVQKSQPKKRSKVLGQKTRELCMRPTTTHMKTMLTAIHMSIPSIPHAVRLFQTSRCFKKCSFLLTPAAHACRS
jgi:hypothetical protein